MADGTTNLADIESLAGSLPLGQMDVTYLGTTYNVDFSGAVTLDDLVTTFNASVPGMELAIRDSSIALISGSPDSFTVVNADATDTASLLGVSGSGTPVRLFGLLEDLKAALEAGDKDAIRGSVNELTALEDTVYKLMMTTGGRQTDLDWAEEVLRATRRAPAQQPLARIRCRRGRGGLATEPGRGQLSGQPARDKQVVRNQLDELPVRRRRPG